MIDMISIKTVISDYIDRTDIPSEYLDEGVIMRFATSSAEKIRSPKQTLHKVALRNVQNYNALLPSDFYQIIEVAYMIKNDRDVLIKDEVVEYVAKNFADCDIKVSVECSKCHKHKCDCGDDASVLIDVDHDWIRANQHINYTDSPLFVRKLVVGGNEETSRSTWHPKFVLMRPAQHAFFGTNYHVPNCINLDSVVMASSPYEYVIENKRIRSNREDGWMLLAYRALPSDEDGYPLIPNDTDVFEAIFWDIESKMLYRNKRKFKENVNLSFQAKQIAEQHFVRAKGKIDAISPLEWSAIVRNYIRKGVSYSDFETQGNRPLGDRFNKGKYFTR